MLDRITPVILTRDEAPNIARTLGQLAWAKDIVVVDSLSTDDTTKIARTFPNVRVLERPFDDLARQWTFALQHVHTPWLLALDADYFVPEALTEEMSKLDPADDISGYEATFRYAIGGRPLRATLYPPHPVLVRRDRTTFAIDGHAHRVLVAGRVLPLREPVIHDDRKSLRNFIARQRKYMRQEALKLRTADPRTLGVSSRIRKLRVIAPLVILPYTLFGKGLILDGRAGLHYAMERFIAELILSWELFKPVRSSDRP
ncbi:MAG TPA: glycosyltransferase family 2 protein [Thermoanaerobaculia bacterium]|nr:glycosyltransferase family 2 protein [Thermoanaerobaculia bacterium]